MISHASVLEGSFYLGSSFLVSFTLYLLFKWMDKNIYFWTPGSLLLFLPLPAILFFLSSTSLSSELKKYIFFVYAILFSILCTYVSTSFNSNRIKWNAKLMKVLIFAWLFVVLFYFFVVRK
jgi:hypothetical protein